MDKLDYCQKYPGEPPSFNMTHPEMLPGERFYSNYRRVEMIETHMMGKHYRIGQQAYDCLGRPILGMPVFVVGG